MEDKDKELENLIKANATAISNNSASISANSTQIAANAEAITKLSAGTGEASEALATLVNANRTLIGQNSDLIAENKTAISNLSSQVSTNTNDIATNASAISQNASKIAEVADLVSSCSTAIANNATAISENATAIAQLRTDMGTMKTEITDAYKSAISSAISTSEGKMNQTIQSEIATVNSTIATEIDKVNTKITALTTRVETLETEVASITSRISAAEQEIDDLIAMVQSIIVVPQYEDGSVKLETPDGADAYISAQFEIYPLSAAQALVSAGTSCFSIRAVSTLTKAPDMYDLPVTSVKYTGGIVTVTANASSLSSTIQKGHSSSSARLLITSGKNSATSGYFQLYVPNKIGSVEGTGDEDLRAVDLGLSVKWASCNVGAANPEDAGGAYQWAETCAFGESAIGYPSSFNGEKNPNYLAMDSMYIISWNRYKYCLGNSTSLTKYCNNSNYGTVDNNLQMDLEDDAAHTSWGGSWRIPTKDEWEELMTSSSITITTTTVNGTTALMFTSTNGNYIVLPMTGYRNSDTLGSTSRCFYWSSTVSPYRCNEAYRFLSDAPDNWAIGSVGRHYGMFVRPVCD